MVPLVSISALLLVAFKVSLVLAGAFVATTLLRRASASARHLVWLAAFTSIVALPFAGAVLPPLSVALPRALDRQPAPAVVAAAYENVTPQGIRVAAFKASPARLAAELALEAAHARATAVMAPAATAPWPLTARVFVLWVFGFILVAVAFAVGVLRTHLVACSALPAGDLIAEEAEMLAASLGIARAVRVVTWPGPTMPMTWGARTPVVLLPDQARDWPASRRREVLTHELAHVSRGDWLARLLAAFVCALHWFNPLVWMAARRMRDEQELACDDAVLASGVRPSDYAAHLLEVARGLRTPPGVAQAAVAMARPSQLSDRLLAVLDDSRARVRAPRSARLAWLMVFLVALPLGAVQPARPALPGAPKVWGPRKVAMGVSRGVPAGTPAMVSVPVTVMTSVPVTVLETAGALATGTERCPEDTRRGASNSTHSSSSSSDDGSPRRVTLSIRVGNCMLEVRILGNVRFNDEGTDVTDVPRDAWVRVTEEGDGPDRRFDATWRNGQLQRRWWVDGTEVAETDELRAWLSTALQTTFTRTGYDAIPRALRAYRAGGLDSTIRLAEATGSDYSRRQMLMALIDSIRIPASDAARIAQQARSMSSDYEKAELLIAVATKVGLDGAVQEAMASSTAGMSSDYERRRVLAAALARDGLTARAAQDLLGTAELMSSDYEKAELLIGYLGKQALTEDRRASFFRAVGSMSSDYERRRVLATVVSRSEASNAIVGDLAAQAERIGSDYERAELLIAMSRRFGGDADARARIRRAALGMSSEYERDRVLATIGRASQ